MQQAQMQMQMRAAEAEIQKNEAQAMKYAAEAQKAQIEAQLEPEVVRAKLVSALSNNLNDDNESADFERRARIAELMIKERDLDIKAEEVSSNERIAQIQMQHKAKEDSEFKSMLE
jgi:hypothetical protein